MLRHLLSVLVAVLLLTGVLVAAAQANAQTPVSNEPAQTTPSQTAAQSDQSLVVRIYYVDRARLEQLAASLDIWAVYPDQGYVEALVQPAQYNALLAQGYHVEIDAVRTAELNQPRTYLPGQTTGIPGYPCYRTVEETYSSAQNIVAAHPTLAQWIDIGDSWEKVTPGGLPGYDLRVLRLTNLNQSGDKPKFFSMASIHAREYAPAELNLRFAEYLINNYGVDPDVTWLLDYNEVQLLLQANPDGRKHAETGNLWRKNTNSNYCASDPNSYGADLNRNFPFHWGGSGSSGVQCDETYRGPKPASEPETQAVVDYVRSQYPDLRPDDLTTAAPLTTTGVFMDLHSYGELVLWPWGFTSAAAPNGTALQTLGRKFAYFNNYTPEQSIGLYPTDGTTDDFTYGTLGVSAYTVEMGTDFFESCTSFENAIVPGNLPALVYAVKAAYRPYMTPAGPDTLNVTVAPTTTLDGATFTLNAVANDTRYRSGSGEPVQNIAAARYTLEAPSWVTGVISYPMTAADGVFNSSIEALQASVDTHGWSVGRHTLFVESQDAAGNWGPPTAVFAWITPAVDGILAGTVRAQDSGGLIEGALITATSGSTLTFETLSQANGSYHLDVAAGTYTMAASKYGYLPASFADVTATTGVTTTRDFTLTLAASYIVSGTIRDQNTGWPLAATITIAGYPGGPLSSDAATGFYSATLAAGTAYTFNVNAMVDGYGPLSRSVGPITSDRTEDFDLAADLTACSAPGYSLIGVRQTFDTLSIPAGWTVVNNIGAAGWTFNNPLQRTNLTGGTGNFAIVDSNYLGSGVYEDTELRTPMMDFSTLTVVTLTFKTDFKYLNGSQAEVADVDLSTNGISGPWTNVWRKTADYRGPQTETIDLTTLAAGQSDVVIRFHYYNAMYEWWWQVDDVRVGACRASGLGLPELVPTNPAQAGDPGATVTYTLQITNTDSDTHTFDVLIDHNTWPVTAPLSIGPLAGYASQPLTLSVLIPMTALGNSIDSAHLTVRAQDNASLSAAARLTTMANVMRGVRLDTRPASQGGGAGSEVTYSLQLTNTGNLTDTFTLGVSEHKWPAAVEPINATVAAFASKPFTVTVTIPLTATPSMTDVVRITATGIGAADFRLLTTASLFEIFLPLMTKD